MDEQPEGYDGLEAAGRERAVSRWEDSRLGPLADRGIVPELRRGPGGDFCMNDGAFTSDLALVKNVVL